MLRCPCTKLKLVEVASILESNTQALPYPRYSHPAAQLFVPCKDLVLTRLSEG